MKNSDRSFPNRLRRDERGAIAIEFALTLPLFVLIFMSMVVFSDFIYAQQKMKNAAANVLNLVNSELEVSIDELHSMMQIVPEVAAPISLEPEDYRVVITAIQRDLGDDHAYIRWQEAEGPLTYGDTQFPYLPGGDEDDNEVTPEQLNGYELFEGEQLIAVEVFMLYDLIVDSPLAQNLLDLNNNNGMRHMVVARPRTGAFQSIPD